MPVKTLPFNLKFLVMIVVCFSSSYSFLGALAKLRKATVRFVVFRWNNTAPTGRIFIKIDIREFLCSPFGELKLH